MLIGFIWEHVGALQNPLFLTVFVLPVIGSIFLSRWHPFLIAAVSVLVVGVVALDQAPELRWYVSGLLGSDAWLAWSVRAAKRGNASHHSRVSTPRRAISWCCSRCSPSSCSPARSPPNMSARFSSG